MRELTKGSVPGLYHGIIRKVRYDKGMIWVILHMPEWSMPEAEYLTRWARVSIPYGTYNYGIWGAPQLKEHVWVAFEEADPELPVVIGYHPMPENPSIEIPPEFGNDDMHQKTSVGIRELPGIPTCAPEPYTACPLCCSDKCEDDEEAEEFAKDPCESCCGAMSCAGASPASIDEFAEHYDEFNEGVKSGICGAVESACGLPPGSLDTDQALGALRKGEDTGFVEGMKDQALEVCENLIDELVPKAFREPVKRFIRRLFGRGDG